jgi:hypothetical protein
LPDARLLGGRKFSNRYKPWENDIFSPLHMALQFVGRGYLEADEGPNGPGGSRFEGRFVIYGLSGAAGPVAGDDVSLLREDGGRGHFAGAGAAHFTAVRTGDHFEHLSTSDDEFVGLEVGRSSSTTRLKVYFDAKPDGTRAFPDGDSFRRGVLVATYQADEYTQIDARAGVFNTRVNYTLLESTPLSYRGTRIDFAELAPTMVEFSHGHAPEALSVTQPIPCEEAPFDRHGPGVFDRQFSVGGTMLVAAGSL